MSTPTKEQIDTALKSLTADNYHAEERVLRTSIEALNSQIAQLQKEVDDFKANNRYQRGYSHGEREQMDKCKNQLAAKDSEIAEAVNAHKQTLEKQSDLWSRIKIAEAKLDENEALICRLETGNRLLSTAYANLQAELKAAREATQWRPIETAMPKKGDIIACRAKHRDGGLMYWAGEVVEVLRYGVALMETRGEDRRRFVITFDTEWMPLPPAPDAANKEVQK